LATITDHINFNGFNPLIGTAFDGSFLSLAEAYDPRLLKRLKRAGAGGGVNLHEGVFLWFAGPSLETPAEIKVARMLGADLVGMSIVPEVILARSLGLKVAAVAVIINSRGGPASGNPANMQTKDFAIQGAVGLRRLIRAFLKTKEQAFTL
jgi:purine-nucleoside phosphorylase